MIYSLEQRERILNMHLKKGYSISAISRLLHVSRGIIPIWLKEYWKDLEHQKQADTNNEKLIKAKETEIKKKMLMKEIEMQIDVLQAFRQETKRWDHQN